MLIEPQNSSMDLASDSRFMGKILTIIYATLQNCKEPILLESVNSQIQIDSKLRTLLNGLLKTHTKSPHPINMWNAVSILQSPQAHF